MVDMAYPLPLGLCFLAIVILLRWGKRILHEELAAQFARRFIQRRDVKAVQFNSGAYVPDRELKSLGNFGPQGFLMPHLLQHLNGEATYGHYLLDSDDNVRVFCFDIDLKTEGFYLPLESAAHEDAEPVAFNPREAWLDRAHPSRPWLKIQMGMLARKLVSKIQTELDGVVQGTAAAYSGNKGIHVYGFTGPMPAKQARAMAHYVLECTDDWELERGQHIYRYKLQDPFLGYPNFNLEVYPKQDSLDNKDLGNLLRLPLGKNLKNPADPTFFLDLTTPPGVMQPHPNPLRLLETGNPYGE